MANTEIKYFKDCKSIEDWINCYHNSAPTLNDLRGAFTAIIRIAFSDAKRMNGSADDLACLLYSDEPGESELYIHASSVKDPSDTEQVPGIIISLGDAGVELDRISWDTTGSYAGDFSARTVNYMASVNVVITCRHANADVACMMSDYVLLYLIAMEDKFRNSEGWVRDYVVRGQTEPKMTSVSQQSGAEVWYESTVTVNLKYEISVFVARESKRLKDFSLTAVPEAIIN